MVTAGIGHRTRGDAGHLPFRPLLLCLHESDVVVVIDHTVLVGNLHMEPTRSLGIVITESQSIDLGNTHLIVPHNTVCADRSFYL